MIRASLVLLLFAVPALAHDSWISRNGHRNAAGEWCCGDKDCDMLEAPAISIRADGYHVRYRTELPVIGLYGERLHYDVNEVVPFREAQPSPDGMYWRCKKIDGSRRCFFAPPPAM